MTSPLFSATIADSLPKPAWLSETSKLWLQWKAEGAELPQAKLAMGFAELLNQEALARQRYGDNAVTR